ncbi:amino acid adenylation domain-containing protein [Lysinibacillus sp. NPDC092081]|uniref:amino acid adenylation domain-containing protein n=1 Tax=Lysinibacillus sp. NPDC092081 TaxID=3364131 RepID=UPI0037F280BD
MKQEVNQDYILDIPTVIFTENCEKYAKKKLFTFLDEKGDVEYLTGNTLLYKTKALGSILQQKVQVQEKAVILLPQGIEYIYTLTACLYANIIAVPAPITDLSDRNKALEKINQILKDSEASFIITNSYFKEFLLKEQLLNVASILDIQDLDFQNLIIEEPRKPKLDDHAILLYTSGSTSGPKGVIISQRNLLSRASVSAIQWDINEDSCLVSWLAQYHSFALDFNIFAPLLKGACSIFFTPGSFISRPEEWFKVIDKYKATHTGAPNFAFDYCCSSIDIETVKEYSLNSIKAIISGGEPVRKESYVTFVKKFQCLGLEKNVFSPLYGMSEMGTITTKNPGQPMRFLSLDIPSLEQGIIKTTRKRKQAKYVASCGEVEQDHTILIVNPDNCELCLPEEVGEIWVKSPSVGVGYLNRKQETEETFNGVISNTKEEGFLRTGDLGFKVKNHLYIIGREKEVIIINGKNHYPVNIEWTIKKYIPSLILPNAVFSNEIDREEKVIVVQELEPSLEGFDYKKVAQEIMFALSETHGINVYEVIFVKEGSIPKTGGHKIQRKACRNLYVLQGLEVIYKYGPKTAKRVESESKKSLEEKRNLTISPHKSTQENIEEYILHFLSTNLKISRDQIKLKDSIHTYGGDSIFIMKFIRDFEKYFNIKITTRELFENRTIKSLSNYLTEKIENKDNQYLGQTGDINTKIEPQEISENRYPLSEGQKGLWMLEKMSPNMTAYNVPICFHVYQKIDLEKFKQAYSFVLEQHPILNSNIRTEKGIPYQFINSTQPVLFRHEDISTIETHNILPYLKEKVREPFSLENGPLIRMHLFSKTQQEHIVLINVNHIIFDGSSVVPFLTTLLNAYKNITEGIEPTKQASTINYNEFVKWQQEMLVDDQEREKHLSYWKQRLSGVLPTLDLPVDRPRSSLQNFKGQVYTMSLSQDFSKQVRLFARSQHINLSVVFLGIFKAMLHQYSDQDDIIVGMPVIGRSEERFDSLIGHFINMIAIRSQEIGVKTFEEFAQELQLNLAEALDYALYPFPTLVKELNIPRTVMSSPVFQVAFFYQNFMRPDDLENLKSVLPIEFVDGIQQEGEYDFTLEVIEKENEFTLNIKYNPELFDFSTITRMMGHYNKLAEGIINDPTLILGEYPLMTEDERNTLLFDWNNTEEEYLDKCFHELFEIQAQTKPDAVAIVFNGESLTYRELNEKSEKLAIYLQKQGVVPDSLVGICVERSLEMVVGLLAIMKAGGAYVPLDPDYPVERLNYIIQESQVSLLLTQSTLLEKMYSLFEKNIKTIVFDRDFEQIENEVKESFIMKREVQPNHLAYVLYTSGSTGKPKGVMITHKALTNFLISMGRKPGISSDDRLLAVTTYCFDIAALELYLPLVFGAQCYICSAENTKNVEGLINEIQRIKPTIMQATPATWLMMFLGGWRNKEKTKILCGGEALPEKLKQYFITTNSTSWNMFGPTETTIWSTIHEINKEEPISIGKPIGNTQIYILDKHLKLAPIGITGELCISGDGVAKGYLNNPNLTAKKFIDNPYNPGTKLYKTGDLARWLPNGNIQYVGRTDDQVKIRGYRIELKDIESHLNSHQDIENSVVVVKEYKGSKRLVAFYIRVKNGTDIDKRKKVLIQSEVLRNYLKAKLPGYMIPVVYIELKTFPLTPNGKVDRKELMNYGFSSNTEGKTLHPQSKIEEEVLKIWKSVLCQNNINVTDNFFEVGGDSLLAVNVSERIKEHLNCDFNVTLLFKYPNIKEISNFIVETKESNILLIEQVEDIKTIDRRCDDKPFDEEIYPDYYQDSIAIIGISCSFPGAKNHMEFWKNLTKGQESSKFFTKDELDQMNYSKELTNKTNYIPMQMTIEGKDLFDPEFFNISNRDAEFMDPQMRLLLQHSWGAIEDAGYVSKDIPETSVFMSASNSFYQAFLRDTTSPPIMMMKDSDEYVSWVLAQGGTIPTMISNKLGLKGPSFFVHSNCSSSLVGLYSAYQGLKSGESKYALVGGATIFPSPNIGYLHQPGLNFSSDGHCKAFDASADGMVGGEGVAVIVLKNTLDAIRDGDNIYCLLRGIGINNDGAEKVGFYAPSIKGQSEVIQKVLTSTNINPESIGYIEAHGTGTKLGDPIELTALSDVYKKYTNKKQFCGIGSVKTNIGHLDTAAGLAGCIKTVLSLYNNAIPPSLHYKEPNPNIDLENSPFYVVDKIRNWPANSVPNRAALSSFGIGGTNGHAIFEQYTMRENKKDPELNSLYIIPISAKNNERLKAYAVKLLHYLKQSTVNNKENQIVNLEENIRREIFEYLSNLLETPEEAIDSDRDFVEQAIDYVQLSLIHQYFQEKWGIDINLKTVIQSESINNLTNQLINYHQKDLVKYFEEKGTLSVGSVPTFIQSEINLANLAYTLQVGREEMESRAIFLVNTMNELINRLEEFIDGEECIENCYQGEVESLNDTLSLFEKDEDSTELINKWLTKGKVNKIAEIWVKGLYVDWTIMYRGAQTHRISLPTYPFAEERYWIPEFETKVINTNDTKKKDLTNSIHPLLHQNTSDFKEQRYSSTFTGQEFFLTDHIIREQKIMPGVAYLEMVRAAVDHATRSLRNEETIIFLKDVIWLRPIVVEEDPVNIHISLYPEKDEIIKFEIFGESKDGLTERITYCQGSVKLSIREESTIHLDLHGLQTECNESTISANQHYESFKKMGIEYGTGHKAVEKIYVGLEKRLAKLSLPTSVIKTQPDFVLHPSLMDSALQASLDLMMSSNYSEGKENSKLILPFALKELEILGACTSEMWAFIQVSDNPKGRSNLRKLDIDLCDEQGKICVRIKGFSSRELVKENQSLNFLNQETIMLQPIWEEKREIGQDVSSNYSQHIVFLFEQDENFSHNIERNMNGVRCFNFQSELGGIDERFKLYTVQMFEEIQRMLKGKLTGKVLIQIVVQLEGEQQLFSGLFGLLKSAQLENPNLTVQLIEVQPNEILEGIIEKLQENSKSPNSHRIQYRNEKCFVFGWNEVKEVNKIAYLPWKEGGTYLITGGAGELGKIFVKEITERVKDVTLVLTGRTALSEEKKLKLDALKSSGVNIDYKQIDMSIELEVERLICDITDQFGQLDGIIHSAGIVQDNFILKKDKKEIEEVLAPKVAGLVNLDHASQNLNLDFFIFFSSVSGVLGNIGQTDYAAANAFMDVYAKYRNDLVASKQRYGQTLSMNWPSWKEGGMHVSKETEEITSETLGMVPMQTQNGIQALYNSLSLGKDQAMVIEGDLTKLRKLLGLTSTSFVEEKETNENPNISHESLRSPTLSLIKQTLVNIVKVSPEKIEIETAFEKYGIDSISQISIIRELEKVTGELPKTLLFEYSNCKELMDYLITNHSLRLAELFVEVKTEKKPKQEISFRNSHPKMPSVKQISRNLSKTNKESENITNRKAEDIAIIGISGRYPMSDSLEELWEHLKAGNNCITEVADNRWNESLISSLVQERRSNPLNKKRYGGFLKHINKFDHHLFEITKNQVLKLSPETRLFLETVWEAFEDGGYAKSELEKLQNRYQAGIGVFVGTMYNQYQWNIPSLDEAMLNSNGTEWHIANRTSHFFNLMGPSIAINSACSSSLTAIHLACESLQQKSCSMAIAGGVNLTLNPSKYEALEHVKFLDSGSESKSFGTGSGYIPGEGVGAVLLKPLSLAIQDNDRIYAVIKSSFVNHSGGRQMYSAPDPKQQTQLIVNSIEKSGIDPATITYVESAANGSTLGDPIEVIALSKAFKHFTKKRQYCALGSVKSNLGHLEAASGISQLSKVLLQLKHQILVPSINANPRNPNINLEDSAFYLQEGINSWTQLKDSETGTSIPRRSMINSFGAGGSYANLIVEEFIGEPESYSRDISINTEQVIIFSAKTEKSLIKYLDKVKALLQGNSNVELLEIAKAFSRINHSLEYKVAILASSITELLEKINLFQNSRGTILDSAIYTSLDQKGNKRNISESAIQQALERRDFQYLAQLWVEGTNVDFRSIYMNLGISQIDIPKYAFDYGTSVHFQDDQSVKVEELEQFNDKRFYLDLVEKISKGELNEEEVEKLIISK